MTIIKDTKGVRYKLSKNKLAGTWSQGYPAFYVFLDDVKKAALYKHGTPVLSVQLYLGKVGPGHYIRVPVGHTNIGCRSFSRDNMKLIKQAVKAAKKAKV